MCRTVHALLQTVICGIQMLVRVFMTIILMIENLIRMILQTLYNFISFLLQMISLIPICAVFLLTARLKCFMCGGGGPCPVNRGGACDCIMSALAIIILFFIFRATGVLDKIFYSIGYIKTKSTQLRFVPTPGDITECSRNESDYTDETDSTTPYTTEPTFLYYETLSPTMEPEPEEELEIQRPEKRPPPPRDEAFQYYKWQQGRGYRPRPMRDQDTETVTESLDDTDQTYIPKQFQRTPNPNTARNWTTIISYM